MIKISVYYEDRAVTEFEQSDGKDITIGRAAGCSIHLDEASISRLHAVLRLQSGSWVLERKASFGAVLLNGQEVENAPLEGGEEITVGKFSLRVNIEGPNPAAAPSSGTTSIYQEEGDGRTRLVSSSVNAIFRFEPGGANVAEYLMTADLAVFGRGSNCDVVLTEKKASRKHFEVRRQGLSFFVKDLDSANGLLVNGNAVKEAELVPGDVIQIGESKIQFVIENKEYFSQQDKFLPVPTHLQQESSEAGMPMVGEGDFGAQGIPGISTGTSSAPQAPQVSPTDLIGRFKLAWSNIPKKQRMRYLTILVVFALVTALLGGPDEAPKPKTRVPPGSKASRTYEQLTVEKKKYVRENYAELIKAQEKKEYAKMLDHTRNIFTYVDDYKDAKSYESIAKKKLEELEEEKRRAEAERKQEALRREVKALEEKGKPIYEKALVDAKFRSELDSIIQEIYAKDPNNRLAQQWKDGIKQKDQEDRDAAEAARVKEENRVKAEAQLESVRKTFQARKYIQALAEAEKLAENGWNVKDYLDRVEQLKTEIRQELSSVIDPWLKDAANQRQEGGDLVKANELYNQVLGVDSNNKEAINGKASIREILHLRAKRLYSEAILAESVSDLTEAREKFERCLRTAPEDDLYKKRCRSKLSRFEYFNSSEKGAPNF